MLPREHMSRPLCRSVALYGSWAQSSKSEAWGGPWYSWYSSGCGIWQQLQLVLTRGVHAWNRVLGGDTALRLEEVSLPSSQCLTSRL